MPFGCFSTNVRAASCATASRLGLTSVEHIDRETSRARMIDVRAIGTLRTTCGRPAASASATRPASRSAIGRCRCQRFRRRQHRAQQRDARVANGLLAPAAQAPPVDPEQARDDEQRQEGERPGEGHVRPPARARAIESTEPSARRSPPAAANSAVTSRGFLTRLELEVDRLVDPRQRRGVARLVVGAVGGVGDLLQHVRVECRRDAEAVDLDDGALLRCRRRSRERGRRRSRRPRRA